jgi:hypothetical protein
VLTWTSKLYSLWTNYFWCLWNFTISGQKCCNHTNFVSNIHYTWKYIVNSVSEFSGWHVSNVNQVNIDLKINQFIYSIFNYNSIFRTMTISLLMMFGRTGSIIGNLLFPFMMSLGCIPPFIMVGSTTLGEAIISHLIIKFYIFNNRFRFYMCFQFVV